MGPEEQPDEALGPVPEQWETAIEDAAQVVALALDRGQDLADLVNDFVRGHPLVTRLLLASAGGAVVGAFIADRTAPRRRRSVDRAAAVIAEASAVARAAAERLARRGPAGEEVAEVVAPPEPPARRRLPLPRPQDARQLAQLVPVALSLLKNPLVRQVLWRSAMRAAKR